MELSPEEQRTLEEDQEILELNDSRPWQLFRARISKVIERLEASLLTDKLGDFDQYLSYWYQRQALLSILGELDSLPREIASLERKASQEPAEGPATGELV